MFALVCNKTMTISSKNSIFPPIAKKNPIYLKKFDSVRLDNYYWLNKREDQEVINYLSAENDYTQNLT